MRDLFKDEFICYNYFRDNNINTRAELRKCLKEKPLKGIRQAIIETFFSDYGKSLRSKKSRNVSGKNYKVACINDLHILYHDEKVIKLVFDCIVDAQPNQLVLNGDILDCYHMSDFLFTVINQVVDQVILLKQNLKIINVEMEFRHTLIG